MDDKRLILLLTSPNRDEWYDNWGFSDDDKFVIRQIGKNIEELETFQDLLKNLPAIEDNLIIWLNGNVYSEISKEDRIEEIKELVEKLVENISGFNILVASHGWGTPTLEGVTTSSFTSYGKDNINYKEILLKLKTEDEFTINLFNKAWYYLEKKALIPKLSFLRNSIARLLLPLNIDLCGLTEVKDAKKQKLYAKEIICEYNNKGKDLFLKLLKNLQLFVGGKKLAEISSTDLSLLNDLMPNGICFIDIIHLAEVQESFEVLHLMDLLGLELKADGEISVKENSAIQKFFLNLNGFDSDAPEDFLKTVNTPIEISDKSFTFHEWLVELDTLLNQLNQMIYKLFHEN